MICIGKTKCTSEKGLLPLATKETFMTFNNLFYVFMGLHVFLCGSVPRADSGEVWWKRKKKKKIEKDCECCGNDKGKSSGRLTHDDFYFVAFLVFLV